MANGDGLTTGIQSAAEAIRGGFQGFQFAQQQKRSQQEVEQQNKLFQLQVDKLTRDLEGRNERQNAAGRKQALEEAKVFFDILKSDLPTPAKKAAAARVNGKFELPEDAVDNISDDVFSEYSTAIVNIMTNPDFKDNPIKIRKALGEITNFFATQTGIDTEALRGTRVAQEAELALEGARKEFAEIPQRKREAAQGEEIKKSLIAAGAFEGPELDGATPTLLKSLQEKFLGDIVEAPFKPAEARATAKDIRGKLRFVDTGEEVFKGVEAPEKERKLSSLEVDFDAMQAALDADNPKKAKVLRQGIEKSLSTKTIRTTVDSEGNVTIEEGDLNRLSLPPKIKSQLIGQVLGAKNALDSMDQIEGLLSNTRIGVKGLTKAFAQDMLQLIAPTNIKNSAALLFDENLPPIKLLGNLLAYSLARASDPNGKLSDFDVDIQRDGLRIEEKLTSPLKIKSNFFGLRVRLIGDHNTAIDALSKGIPLEKLPVPTRGETKKDRILKALQDLAE